MKKPNQQELEKIIKQARELLDSEKVVYAKLQKLIDDIDAIGISNIDKIRNYIRNATNEFGSNNYVGKHPPELSNDKDLQPAHRSIELFEFAWESKIFGAKMYFKFGIKNGIVVVFSIHKAKR